MKSQSFTLQFNKFNSHCKENQSAAHRHFERIPDLTQCTVHDSLFKNSKQRNKSLKNCEIIFAKPKSNKIMYLYLPIHFSLFGTKVGNQGRKGLAFVLIILIPIRISFMCYFFITVALTPFPWLFDSYNMKTASSHNFTTVQLFKCTVQP